MSKLYLKGGTDARRTPLTARAHRNMHMQFLFNWKGGNVPSGGVEAAMFHRGDHVEFIMAPMGTADSTVLTFFPDGTYRVGRG